MKLIHCADLHLDAKMTTWLDETRAKERKAELLHTFERMVEYADAQRVRAILICGDLFDTARISASARNAVFHVIETHPQIHFYLLKGNHDRHSFPEEQDAVPDNLFRFGTQWRSYEEGCVQITGAELSDTGFSRAAASLVLNPKKRNIVMLHGQTAEYGAGNQAEVIDLRSLRGLGIDYLALGHIHAYQKGALDARGIYCYPGCLEGRGFDECGPHGFVLLEVDEDSGRMQSEFVPFAKRQMYEVEADVTDAWTSAQMVPRIQNALQDAGCSPLDLVKIILTGAVDVECEKDIDYLSTRFAQQYYCAVLEDRTTLRIDLEEYRMDESLKGEFVRLVMAQPDLSEEEKRTVIRYGLQALAGEEVR